MKPIFLLLFCLLFTQWSFGQEDSLVFYGDLKFASEAEKEAYDIYLSGAIGKDLLGVFILANRDLPKQQVKDYGDRLDLLLLEFQSKKWAKKPVSKKVKGLYKKMHEELFKQYQLENHSVSVFSDGAYNCVSASAIFAVAFEKLEIPYTVLEAPAHVYLAANPGKDRILVETTDPVKGYFEFDQGFKNNFRNHLKRSKLISEEEYYTASTDQLFDKYYFAETTIDIRELAGLQYSNLGIYLFKEDKYKEALIQLEKSYLLYPTEKTVYLLIEILLQLSGQNEYADVESAAYLGKCSRYVSKGLDPEIIIGEFYGITNRYLINTMQHAHYDSLYKELEDQIKDTALLREITFIYHYEKGRVLLRNGREGKAFANLELAMEIKPENTDLHSMLVLGIDRKIAAAPGPQSMLAILKEQEAKFPVLDSNGLFRTMKMEVYLWNASEFFDKNKLSNAASFLEDFEQFKVQNPDLSVDANLVTRAYGDGAAAYFRKGRVTQARTTIKKGLEFVPNSFELKRRLEMIR